MLFFCTKYALNFVVINSLTINFSELMRHTGFWNINPKIGKYIHCKTFQVS